MQRKISLVRYCVPIKIWIPFSRDRVNARRRAQPCAAPPLLGKKALIAIALLSSSCGGEELFEGAEAFLIQVHRYPLPQIVKIGKPRHREGVGGSVRRRHRPAFIGFLCSPVIVYGFFTL